MPFRLRSAILTTLLITVAAFADDLVELEGTSTLVSTGSDIRQLRIFGPPAEELFNGLAEVHEVARADSLWSVQAEFILCQSRLSPEDGATREWGCLFLVSAEGFIDEGVAPTALIGVW